MLGRRQSIPPASTIANSLSAPGSALLTVLKYASRVLFICFLRTPKEVAIPKNAHGLAYS
jgi:hypothetical protein